MKTVRTVCDKCGDVILEGGSALEVAAGDLRKRRGPQVLDLCHGCVDGFLSWLAEGPATLPALEPAEASA